MELSLKRIIYVEDNFVDKDYEYFEHGITVTLFNNTDKVTVTPCYENNEVLNYSFDKVFTRINPFRLKRELVIKTGLGNFIVRKYGTSSYKVFNLRGKEEICVVDKLDNNCYSIYEKEDSTNQSLTKICTYIGVCTNIPKMNILKINYKIDRR